jgi:uncharacterized integral membrane protein
VKEILLFVICDNAPYEEPSSQQKTKRLIHFKLIFAVSLISMVIVPLPFVINTDTVAIDYWHSSGTAPSCLLF